MQAFLSMTKYIRKNWKLWLCGILVPALFSTATNLYFASCLQKYVTQVTGQQTSFQEVCKMLLIMLPVLLLLSWMDNVGICLFSLFVVSTENELRYDFYGSLVSTSLKNVQALNHGEFITRYGTDVEQSTRIISNDIFGVVYPLIVGSGYLAAVLLADFWIGLLMLLPGVFVMLLNFKFVPEMKRAQAAILQERESFTSGCSDAIRGKMSIRQYSAQKRMIHKIEEAADRLYRKECEAVRLGTLKLMTSDALADSCIYLLTPLACVLAACGYIGVPVVLFIHQLCRYFIGYTQNFAASFLRYSEHALSFERVSSVLSFENEMAERGADSWEKVPERFTVSFENVCVAYGNRQVLRDISFTVSPGECIGIVGEGGSGKSTLVKALMQMIAYAGEIYIGGENCRNISLPALRECIAYSPEHSDLFPAAVYENIKYGNWNAGDEDVKQAAEMAGITAHKEVFFRRSPGENGDQLSGGQKQKVSIARALLKDAPIFIFDEPTAVLDADSEAKILDTILRLKRAGKCILLITHKASTLWVADRILRIEGGRVFRV